MDNTQVVKPGNNILTSEDTTLEHLLFWLSNYGDPRLFRIGGRWLCSVELFVAPTSLQARSRSSGYHSGPKEAAYQVYDIIANQKATTFHLTKD